METLERLHSQPVVIIRVRDYWCCNEPLIIIRVRDYWRCNEPVIIIRVRDYWRCNEPVVIIRVRDYWRCNHSLMYSVNKTLIIHYSQCSEPNTLHSLVHSVTVMIPWVDCELWYVAYTNLWDRDYELDFWFNAVSFQQAIVERQTRRCQWCERRFVDIIPIIVGLTKILHSVISEPLFNDYWNTYYMAPTTSVLATL